MLQIADKQSNTVRHVAIPSMPAAAAPPVIVTVKTDLHPVFGNIPIGKDGCTLVGQPIEWLNHCHKRATKLLEPWNAPGEITDEEDKAFQEIHNISWDIYRAACEADLQSASRVATFLELTERHHFGNGGDSDNIVISDKWLRKVTADLKAATAFPRPTKRIGALSKGKKLTRAGLLHRYHAFLIGELHTLGWGFYGSRDYASLMVPIDSAVQARTSNNFKNGKPIDGTCRRKVYPFFDESKLPDRARSVLKSLKIDIETANCR